MEYSLKEVQRQTKISLLSDKEVFEFYQDLYGKIFDAAKRGNVLYEFKMKYCCHKPDESVIVTKAMHVFEIDGFNVKFNNINGDIYCGLS